MDKYYNTVLFKTNSPEERRQVIDLLLGLGYAWGATRTPASSEELESKWGWKGWPVIRIMPRHMIFDLLMSTADTPLLSNTGIPPQVFEAANGGPTIYVGNDKVEFLDDGSIVVGCQTVNASLIETIYKRSRERYNK